MQVVTRWMAARSARNRVQTILGSLGTLDVPEPLIDLAARPMVIAPTLFESWRRWGEMDARCQAFNAGDQNPLDISLPEHGRLLEKQEQTSFSCDLREVEGIFFSKSDLRKYSTIAEFARRDREAREFIGEDVLPVDPSSVDQLIDSVLARHGGQLDFAHCEWERRLYLNESDGSHRLAAAQLMATELDLARTLPGKCARYSISPSAVEALSRRVRIVHIGDDAGFWLEFQKIMERGQAEWYQVPMPEHGHREQLFGFPADELGDQIAELMIDGGGRDFVETLRTLAA